MADAQTGSEDGFDPRPRKRRVIVSTDDYIDQIVGSQSDGSGTESEGSSSTGKKAQNKGKGRAGERIEWSDEDGGNIYETFKNRHSIKRKRQNAVQKLRKQRALITAKRAKSGTNSGSSKTKERLWGDPDEADIVDEEIPEYLRNWRKEFDEQYQKLNEAGLKLPPHYDDIEFSDDERLAELDERPEFPPSVAPSRAYEDVPLPRSGGFIPASIAQYLRDYQIKGVEFLHELFVYQKGGILGDDMGLGKTVQVAAFLTAAFGKTGDERDAKRMRKMRKAPHKPWYPRVLVICPGTLQQNWKKELAHWGWWHVDVCMGTAKSAVIEAAMSGRLEVVITTYTTYKKNMSEINMVKWDCVVADECHQLKEKTSQTTQAMNEINALCRIGLTGTAIQNNYSELWTLLNWTNPGRFGPLSTWKSSISEPLTIGQSHDATYHQLKQARQTAKRLVHNLLPQFFRRRMKSLIAHQLPKKSDRVVFCQLTEAQTDAYERFLESEIVEAVKNSSQLCACGSGKKSGWCCNVTVGDSETKWQIMFPLITTLQKLSNHLALLLPNSADPHDKQERDLEFLKLMVPDKWRELYENRDSLFNLANPEFCGKWVILKKLLQYWHENGDKVLIFSHSVRLLTMLQHLFKYTSYNVNFLSGAMPYEDRQKEVDDFNSDPGQFVFLISTKAGGVGLNITSANKVVIFDPNWNPAFDLQAQDRAYRIGQLRDVEVFRLVSAGTVEEIVYARQIYKQQQANIGYNASTERRYFSGVQNRLDQKGELFGLENLLSFHADNIVLRDIVNKTNVAEAKRGVDILDFDVEDAANDEDNPLKVDDDDDGNGAMSQLAALLTEDPDSSRKQKHKSKPPKTDAILAILSSAGVEYTHENSEVIGSSRVEALLSRRAEETGNDIERGEERLFDDADSSRRYTFHPPEDVMIRQFCSMAQEFGFATVEEFALCVEGWTQVQRTDCLARFYERRRRGILELEEAEEDGEERDRGKGAGVVGRGGERVYAAAPTAVHDGDDAVKMLAATSVHNTAADLPPAAVNEAKAQGAAQADLETEDDDDDDDEL